jgi:hypothetical protein
MTLLNNEVDNELERKPSSSKGKDDLNESYESFGRDKPSVDVTKEDTDIQDFKKAVDLKFEHFRKEVLEKYQKMIEELNNPNYVPQVNKISQFAEKVKETEK